MRTNRIASIPAAGIGPEMIAAGLTTPDLGGTATAAQVTRAVCQAIEAANLPA